MMETLLLWLEEIVYQFANPLTYTKICTVHCDISEGCYQDTSLKES